MVFVSKTRAGERPAQSQKTQKRLLTEGDAELDRLRKRTEALRALRLEKEVADAAESEARKAERAAAAPVKKASRAKAKQA